jgi:aminomethyltransferase
MKSIKHDDVTAFVDMLLAHSGVEMIGLGARDSLRLEAGLCLYSAPDIDKSVSPMTGLFTSPSKTSP